MDAARGRSNPVMQSGPQSPLARQLQMLVQMSQAGELTGELRRTRRARRTPRAEITPSEEIAPGDYGGAQRPVFVRALRPRELLVHPEIEPHRLHLTPQGQVQFQA